MSSSREQIIAMLFESIDEINKQLDRSQWLSRTRETVILGENELDSVVFLNFVALVEEKLEQRFGKTVVLNETSSFSTVDVLATHIENLIAC